MLMAKNVEYDRKHFIIRFIQTQLLLNGRQKILEDNLYHLESPYHSKCSEIETIS